MRGSACSAPRRGCARVCGARTQRCATGAGGSRARVGDVPALSSGVPLNPPHPALPPQQRCARARRMPCRSWRPQQRLRGGKQAAGARRAGPAARTRWGRHRTLPSRARMHLSACSAVHLTSACGPARGAACCDRIGGRNVPIAPPCMPHPHPHRARPQAQSEERARRSNLVKSANTVLAELTGERACGGWGLVGVRRRNSARDTKRAAHCRSSQAVPLGPARTHAPPPRPQRPRLSTHRGDALHVARRQGPRQVRRR